MEQQETVTMTKVEYHRMLDQIEFLNCLEACGVDNWGGYEYAQGMMREGEDDE